MAKIRFLYQNLLQAAGVVVSSSSSVPALPPTNVVVPDRTLVWRSTSGPGDQWIAFDLGSAQTVTGAAIANPKLHQGGSLKLQHSPDGIAWTDAGTPGAADTDSKVAFVWVSSIARQHWRWYFTNTGAVTDYVKTGVSFVGPYFEPTVNVTVPFDAPLGMQTTVVEAPGGQRTGTIREQRSRGRWSWTAITDADLANIQALLRTVDISLPFFQVLDDTRGWTAWLACANGPLTRAFNDVTGRYDPGFDWIEAL